MSENALEVSGVGKSYLGYASNAARFASWFGVPVKPTSENWVLRDINFTLKRGESLALIGRNGAGKSTLLKIITGTVRPSEGSLSVNGRISAILELGLGFNPEFSGRQNVYQAGGLMGFSRDDLTALMPEIEAFAELHEYFDQTLRVYSSGMQARLAFALATAARPDILIVDEVLSVGDAYFQAKCYQRIAEFKKLGTSMLLVTHATGDVVKHCDRAIFIREGGIAFDGEPREATNHYMDELFGKRRAREDGQPAPASAPAPAQSLDAFSDGEEERFHLRNGYRKEEYRWGHGGARILDYVVRADGKDYPAVLAGHERVEFYFSVLFEHDYDDITPGFLLKAHDGVFIYGTNSFLARQGGEPIAVRAGERRIFSFSMSIPLNSGHYLISFGISTGPQENLTPLDRRYDSIMLTVERPVGFWGLCDFEAEFSVIEGTPS